MTPSNIYYFRNAKELKFNLFSNGRPFWGELELEDRGRKGREGEIGKVRGWKVMEGVRGEEGIDGNRRGGDESGGEGKGWERRHCKGSP